MTEYVDGGTGGCRPASLHASSDLVPYRIPPGGLSDKDIPKRLNLHDSTGEVYFMEDEAGRCLELKKMKRFTQVELLRAFELRQRVAMFTDDIEEAIKHLRQSQISFSTHFGSTPQQIQKLIVLKPGVRARDCIKIIQVPSNYLVVDAFCKALKQTSGIDIKYTGGSLAAFTHVAIGLLMRSVRAGVSSTLRRELLVRQGYKCQECGAPLKLKGRKADHSQEDEEAEGPPEREDEDEAEEAEAPPEELAAEAAPRRNSH